VFGSGETFTQFVSDSTLDAVLGKLGSDEILTLFGIKIEDDSVHFEFPGWPLVADESSHLTLIQEIRYTIH
jgi:hypothetical protein